MQIMPCFWWAVCESNLNIPNSLDILYPLFSSVDILINSHILWKNYNKSYFFNLRIFARIYYIYNSLKL